jgi:hypothetical protein
VARYPCIMIISHLDALNPAACHRPVPSCTIFFRLDLSTLPRPRLLLPSPSCSPSFTGTLRCNQHGSYRRYGSARLGSRHGRILSCAAPLETETETIGGVVSRRKTAER